MYTVAGAVADMGSRYSGPALTKVYHRDTGGANYLTGCNHVWPHNLSGPITNCGGIFFVEVFGRVDSSYDGWGSRL